jgi:hypothetical protein
VEFVFGDHALDVDRRELRRDAELIALNRRSLISWSIWFGTAIALSARTTCWKRCGAARSSTALTGVTLRVRLG